jgi:hypothetical protein
MAPHNSFREIAKELAIYGTFISVILAAIWIGRCYEKYEQRYLRQEEKNIQFDKDLSDHSQYIQDLKIKWAAHTGATNQKSNKMIQ